MITSGNAVDSAYTELVNNGQILYWQWEQDLLNWFQTWHTPILNKIMYCITMLGKAGLFWMFITLMLLLFAGNRQYKAAGNPSFKNFIFQHEKQVAWASFWALVLSVVIVNLILKNVTARVRPAWILNPADAMMVTQDDYSFPSGHASASFSSAVAIFNYNKKWGTAAIILAAMIALSRLYLFIHWPTDVFVGVIIGIFDGCMGTLIAKTIGKKFA